MAKGRELKGRIKSVENTRKITRTLEMVATSKMKRTQDRVSAARPYAEALREVIASLYSPELAERFPLLRQPARDQARRGHRAHGEPRPRRRVQREPDQGSARDDRAARRQGVQVDVHGVGKKGIGYFRYLGRNVRHAAHRHRRQADGRAGRGDRERSDRARSRRASSMRCTSIYPELQVGPRRRRRRPCRSCRCSRPKRARSSATTSSSPDAETILGALLPLYVRNAIYRALVEMTAAFYAAQRTAMKNATDNASDMLKVLGRTYNRARQASITQEIAEIVGGAAALQG